MKFGCVLICQFVLRQDCGNWKGPQAGGVNVFYQPRSRSNQTNCWIC